MKRVIQMLAIACVLYFSYQGWQKFILSENESSTQLEGLAEEAKSDKLIATINDVVANIQASLSSFVTETTDYAVPASVAKVSQTDDAVVDEIAAFLATRTSQFVVQVYGDRKMVSQSMDMWIETALAKDDYIRYALHGYTYSIMGYSQYSEVSFAFDFRESEEQTDYVRVFVKDLLEQHNIASLSDREKIKWINDWIVTHVQYDQSLTKYTAYEALTEKFAVCQGYALLGEMLLQEAGLESRIVEGEVATGNHAWNMVMLDGQWYHIDFTWNDPTGQAEDEVSYQYFLVSDVTIRNDHSWTKQYPAASVDYRNVLNEQIAVATNAEYDELTRFREALQLHWFEDEYTVGNQSALVERVKAVTSHRSTEFSFRYLETDTLIGDLKQAFQASNVRLTYNVQYKPLSSEGDSLVTVALTYY